MLDGFASGEGCQMGDTQVYPHIFIGDWPVCDAVGRMRGVYGAG
jgi:hypothetical protein